MMCTRPTDSNAVAAAPQTDDADLMTLVDAASALFDRQNKTNSPPTVSSKKRSNSSTQFMKQAESASYVLGVNLIQDTMVSPSPPSLPARTMVVSVSSFSQTNNEGMSSSSSIFLSRLRKVLNEDQVDVLQWMPHGNSFHVVHPKMFGKTVLPQIFQLKTMSSFLRKLNQLGFQRIHDRVTMNLDIFQHEAFTRDDPVIAETGYVGVAPNHSTAIVTSTLGHKKRSLCRGVSEESINTACSSQSKMAHGHDPSALASLSLPPLQASPSSSYRRATTELRPRIEQQLFPTAKETSTACTTSSRVVEMLRRRQGLHYAPKCQYHGHTFASSEAEISFHSHAVHYDSQPLANPLIHHVNFASQPHYGSGVGHQLVMIDSLLRERDSLLRGVDCMSYTLQTLLRHNNMKYDLSGIPKDTIE